MKSARTVVACLVFSTLLWNPSVAQATSAWDVKCAVSDYSCAGNGYNPTSMMQFWGWGHYGNPAAGYIGSPYPHNCTLYASYMLWKNGLTTDPGNWGDASNWGNALSGVKNQTPAVGSIAWWSFGHVGYVQDINWSNGTVYVTSDNYNRNNANAGYTSNGWLPISGTNSPTGFLHIRDLASGGSSSAGNNLVLNGGFENGWGPWSAYSGTGTNFVNYQSGQVAGESALSGRHYGATNTSSSGGGIFQDISMSAAPGDLYCGSAWVRTQSPSTGASGEFVLWLLGGAYNENGVVSFSGLGNGGNWTEVKTCVAASTAHSLLRVQFYPKPGSPTLDIDNVDVHKSIVLNGGFENGWGPWSAYSGTGTNFVNYQSGQVAGESALSGRHYGATNTSSSGGGIYQDISMSAAPGDLYCGSAWVRTQSPSTGASGEFVLWLLGGAYNENGVVSFSGLGNGGNWTEVKTCVAASTAHSLLRVQFYPKPGSPTLDIDNVDVHG